MSYLMYTLPNPYPQHTHFAQNKRSYYDFYARTNLIMPAAFYRKKDISWRDYGADILVATPSEMTIGDLLLPSDLFFFWKCRPGWMKNLLLNFWRARQILLNACWIRLKKWQVQIDFVTVFDAILTSRQTREKLQCLYENLMSNNFRKTAVLKKISIVN